MIFIFIYVPDLMSHLRGQRSLSHNVSFPLTRFARHAIVNRIPHPKSRSHLAHQGMWSNFTKYGDPQILKKEIRYSKKLQCEREKIVEEGLRPTTWDWTLENSLKSLKLPKEESGINFSNKTKKNKTNCYYGDDKETKWCCIMFWKWNNYLSIRCPDCPLQIFPYT